MQYLHAPHYHIHPKNRSINCEIKSQWAACKTFCGLTFQDSAEPLHWNLPFKLRLIVPLSCGNLGNTLIVLLTSAGTLTMLPKILSCPPLGACKSFSNASLGANILRSFRSKKADFGGNCMPLTAGQGATLFLDKYLHPKWWNFAT